MRTTVSSALAVILTATVSLNADGGDARTKVTHTRFADVDDTSLTVLNGRLRRSVPRADIVEVTSEPKGSTVGGYVGASLGIVLGVSMAASIALGCDGHCGGGAIAGEWLAFVGTPVGLGFFGYNEFRGRPELIYLAP